VRHYADANPDSHTDPDTHANSDAHSDTHSDTHSDAHPDSHSYSDTYSNISEQLPAMGTGQGLCRWRQGNQPWRLLSMQGSGMVFVYVYGL
jgi:hypothetical protein